MLVIVTGSSNHDHLQTFEDTSIVFIGLTRGRQLGHVDFHNFAPIQVSAEWVRVSDAHLSPELVAGEHLIC